MSTCAYTMLPPPGMDPRGTLSCVREATYSTLVIALDACEHLQNDPKFVERMPVCEYHLPPFDFTQTITSTCPVCGHVSDATFDIQKESA